MKKSKKIRETKEDKSLNTWLPIGLMFGSAIGMILTFKYDDIMYLTYCTTGGLLLSLLLSSILSADNIKIEFKKKK